MPNDTTQPTTTSRKHGAVRSRRGAAFGVVLALAGAVPSTQAQAVNRDPHIAYLNPAGGRQGDTVRVIAGGQFLRGAKEVHIVGEGVEARIVQFMRPLRSISAEQRILLGLKLRQAWEERLADAGIDAEETRKVLVSLGLMRPLGKKKMREMEEKTRGITLPDHPLLDDLQGKSAWELLHIRDTFFFPREKLQENRQLAEMLLIEFTVAPDAAPGPREVRVYGRNGITNPVAFLVGELPEHAEIEPNNTSAWPDFRNLPVMRGLPDPKPLQLPITVNGCVMPGDVDRFRFFARRGQNLVFHVRARDLKPYLADAVPGWFQATLALYDANGTELAFVDDFRHRPDPILTVNVPADGEYEIAIRDAIYRGREDFVYRLAIGELPVVTDIFPLGAPAGTETTASLRGYNLAVDRIQLPVGPGPFLRQVSARSGPLTAPAVRYAVDSLEELREAEPNNTPDRAQPVPLGTIVNGRIETPQDVDRFAIDGKAGQTIVADVTARAVDSPLDGLLRLFDHEGNRIAWNDDYVQKAGHLHRDRSGWITHHADPYLSARLPADGRYTIALRDTRGHGGPAFAYRLRISTPRPDFAVRVTPSSLFARAGAAVPITIHILRRDGFAAPVTLRLAEAPEGTRLDGYRVPAGCDRLRMTVTAPRKAPGKPVAIRLEATAIIDGRKLVRAARPADEQMQAFLWRHLVPADQHILHVAGGWPVPPLTVTNAFPVRIPAGGAATLNLTTPSNRALNQLVFALDDPPPGITIDTVTRTESGVAFRLLAANDAATQPTATNCIVAAFREFQPKTKDGKKNNAAKRRVRVGSLPAIPIQITP